MMSQTNIYQFFSPVSAEEARTANAGSRNNTIISQSDESIPNLEQIPRKRHVRKRFKGILIDNSLYVTILLYLKKNHHVSPLSWGNF